MDRTVPQRRHFMFVLLSWVVIFNIIPSNGKAQWFTVSKYSLLQNTEIDIDVVFYINGYHVAIFGIHLNDFTNRIS